MSRRSKQFGQNFIVRGQTARKLVHLTDIGVDEYIYEIGTGLGIITRELARRSRYVESYEIDSGVYHRARERLQSCGTATLLNRDFFRVPLFRTPYVVFGNIPFNRTTATVRKLFLQESEPPRAAWLLVEAGAAGRIACNGRSSILGCLVTARAIPTVLTRVARRDFHPAPRVDAVLLELRTRSDAPDLAWLRRYREYLTRVFSGRHPTVGGNLRNQLARQRWRALAAELDIPRDAVPSALASGQHRQLFLTLERTIF